MGKSQGETHDPIRPTTLFLNQEYEYESVESLFLQRNGESVTETEGGGELKISTSINS